MEWGGLKINIYEFLYEIKVSIEMILNLFLLIFRCGHNNDNYY